MLLAPLAVPALWVLSVSGPVATPAPSAAMAEAPVTQASIADVGYIADGAVGTPTPPGCQYRPWLDPFHPYTHCHTWGHQLYLDAWGMPYFSVGFGRLGFYPSYPWGSYWGLDVRYLNLGWGHAHGPHFAGTTGLVAPRVEDERGLTPAKSFTVQKKGTARVAAGGDGLELRPFLRRTGGADWTAMGVEGLGIRGIRTAGATPRPAEVDLDPSRPSRWSSTDSEATPTQVAPVDAGEGGGVVTQMGSLPNGSVIPPAKPVSPSVISTKRSRPVEATWTQVSSSQVEAINQKADAYSTIRRSESRSRIRIPPRTQGRAIDRAAASWDLTRSSSRSSQSFSSRRPSRSSRGIDRLGTSRSSGSASARSGSRGSTKSGATRTKRERSSGTSGSTKVRKGGGGL